MQAYRFFLTNYQYPLQN